MARALPENIATLAGLVFPLQPGGPQRGGSRTVL